MPRWGSRWGTRDSLVLHKVHDDRVAALTFTLECMRDTIQDLFKVIDSLPHRDTREEVLAMVDRYHLRRAAVEGT